MKKLLLLTAALCCLFFTSCGAEEKNHDNLTVNCETEETERAVSSTYDLFTGEREYTIRVADGEEVTASVEITTEQGDLAMTIGREGAEADYVGSHLPSSTFAVMLRESGEYTVHIAADSHRGGYAVRW